MYTITTFRNAELTTGSRQEKTGEARHTGFGERVAFDTFDLLVEHCANNTVSLNEYTDNKRAGSHFLRTNLIGLDVDDNLSLTDTLNKLKDLGYKYGIYTSFNHGKDGVDKFRVILQLSQTITDETTYKATWSHIHTLFNGVDKQCSDVARFYFHSNPATKQTFVRDGLLIPIVNVVQQITKPVLKTHNSNVLTVVDNDGWESIVRKNRLPENVRKWISGIDDYGEKYIPTQGERSGNLYKYAHLCKERGYDFDWCIEKLGQPLRDDPDYVAEYGGVAEVEKKIISTIKQVFSKASRYDQPDNLSATMLSDPEMFVDHWTRSQNYRVNRNGMFVHPNGELSPKIIMTKIRLDYSKMFTDFRRSQADVPKKERHTVYRVKDSSLNDAVINLVQNRRDDYLYTLRKNIAHQKTSTTEMEKFCRAITGKNDPVIVAVMNHFVWQVKRKVFGLPVTYHMMPIIVGPQGNGKSTAIREHLLTPLNDFIMTPKMNHFHDEKHYEGFQWNYVAFCDEMAGAERADIDGIKEWISKDEQTGREMYSTSQVRYKQNCTAIGCSNKSVQTLLYDPTGLRRFFEIRTNPNMEQDGGWDLLKQIDFVALWQSVDEQSNKIAIGPYSTEIEALQEEMRMADNAEMYMVETDGIPANTDDVKDVATKTVYSDYSNYCFEHGMKKRSASWFGARLKDFGIVRRRIRENNKRIYIYTVSKKYTPFN